MIWVEGYQHGIIKYKKIDQLYMLQKKQVYEEQYYKGKSKNHKEKRVGSLS